MLETVGLTTGPGRNHTQGEREGKAEIRERTMSTGRHWINYNTDKIVPQIGVPEGLELENYREWRRNFVKLKTPYGHFFAETIAASKARKKKERQSRSPSPTAKQTGKSPGRPKSAHPSKARTPIFLDESNRKNSKGNWPKGKAPRVVGTHRRSAHELDGKRILWSTTDGTTPIKFHGRSYYGVDERIYSPSNDLPASVKERLLISPFQVSSTSSHGHRNKNRRNARPRTASPSPNRRPKSGRERSAGQRPKSGFARGNRHAGTGAVTNVKVSLMRDNCVDVSWRAPSKGAPIRHYKILVWEEEEDEDSARELLAEGKGTTFSIDNLEEGVTYLMSITAIGSEGEGETSAPVKMFGYNVPDSRPSAPEPEENEESVEGSGDEEGDQRYLQDEDFYKEEDE
eukprot:Nk52_evm27s208 gene=Nk52_evmTU27s208